MSGVDGAGVADDLQQRTLASPARVRGVGLFTAGEVTATITPAEPDTGIVFRRSDLEGRPAVPAHVEHVEPAARRTVLRDGEARVETVEHCLAALAGMGVDNAEVALDGPEMPIGDGSALLFTEAIHRAGTVEQDALREPIIIHEPMTVRDGDATLAVFPAASETMELTYLLDYGQGSPIERQSHSFSVSDGSFAKEIAPARTYSTEDEARAARAMGLFEHLEPKDMLVIGRGGPIDNTFRFDNEPVRHKLLDLLGDISLVGRPVRGRLVAYRSGHALNHGLARLIVEHDAERAGDSGGGAAGAMEIGSIMRLLPHRYPMILIDRVIEMESDQRAVGVKNVTINEPFFQGHYPDTPIMPGVLIVEAMCQLAGLMLSQKLERTGKIAVLLSMDGVRLRRPVTPGDQLVIETEAVKSGRRYGDVQCRGYVSGRLVAEARVKFAMMDAERNP
jgi:UDP-3-O-[3-hydroxymyristoyl] N-acetylglucosamine deacetylase/3-hydroxyacyl-[acyl-carrier-protein] dehydratase